MGDDVGAEILLRLPAKAVLRCRAVCRSWRRITTTAYFVAAHSRRRPLQLLGYTGLAVDSSSSPYSYVFTVGVTVGDTVYWGRRQTDDRGQMSAFDTVSETFRRVAPPPPVSHADEGPMFDMHGALAVTAMSSTEPYMDVWIAAAAGGENWVRLLRVELPPGHYYSGEVKPHGYGKAVLDDAGVLLVAMNGCPSFLYDTKGKRMVTGELLSSYQRFYLPELTLLLLTTLSQKYHHR
ncbi:uncharacterized protein LOC127761077 [Oryza glaberrima]|uniref:F-box domain-containing protein n=1 Tax=Oryza glaberrima TaxID=4538 RepID=I1NWX7_ORYGL|nr:uncharacterized protein LOC127761077 [Oryza glaberrima]